MPDLTPTHLTRDDHRRLRELADGATIRRVGPDRDIREDRSSSLRSARVSMRGVIAADLVYTDGDGRYHLNDAGRAAHQADRATRATQSGAVSTRAV